MCTPECEKVFAKHAKEAGKYDDKWPDHCEDCDGWGGRFVSYDPSPAGVGLSSGSFSEWEPCDSCTEKEKCPRCGTRNLRGGYGNLRCCLCKWRERKTHGRPAPPECFCPWWPDLQPIED